MGREVRMVPADWIHPKYPDDHYEEHLRGRYIALHDFNYKESAKEWDEGWAKWQQGLRENYGGDEKWIPIDPEDRNIRYTDYAGSRPSPDDYMPAWTDEQKTHLMMYETTSEGTPISPAFETPEELARWLTDNNASSFGNSGASYEQWLTTCRNGWAPSAIFSKQTGLISGVEAGLAQTEH